MTDMTRALRHLAWTNDKLFREMAALPPEALDASYAPTAWPVGQLAVHIVGGTEWYCYCLAGMQWTDLTPPTGPADLEQLRQRLADLDAVLIAQAPLVDELVEFEDEDGPRTALRSTILAQACLHATEHRAQIACALEVHGWDLTLDDYDVWAFAEQE
ncbi:MAG: DinB family protein [Candidatus Nanopelagicales bacterium]